MAKVLLDTCAIIFVANGLPIEPAAKQSIIEAVRGDGVLVSPISAWEIGLLAAKRNIGFLPDPKSWFHAFLGQTGVRLAPLSVDAAIESSFLPPPLHGDPADRLLMASARALGVPIVTRDRLILDYAARGGVEVVPC